MNFDHSKSHDLDFNFSRMRISIFFSEGFFFISGAKEQIANQKPLSYPPTRRQCPIAVFKFLVGAMTHLGNDSFERF